MNFNSLQTMGQKQAGIALIAVLMFLILIMIVGAIAVRQSRVDLGVATSDQINGLTLNAADSSLAYIEQAAGGVDHPDHKNIFSGENSMFGYFVRNSEAKVGHQISACHTPGSTSFFDRSEGRTLIPPGGTQGTGGICDPDDASSYISGRNTAMNQIIVTGDRDKYSDNFSAAETGSSDPRKTNKFSPYVTINSVALLPSMSSASSEQIKGCLGRPTGDATLFGVDDGNMNDCLRRIGVPNRNLVEEGRLADLTTGGYDENADSIVGL